MALKTIFLFIAIILSTSLLAAAPPEQAQPALLVLDKNGSAISKLTDGDSVKLGAKLSRPADQPIPISFILAPDNTTVAECTVPKGSDACQTELLQSLGWFWDKNKQAQKSRTLRATSPAQSIPVSAEVQVVPRPVVFVHGFGSSAKAWEEYLGPSGYLASLGVKGFAVGDGQVKGTLNLGDLTHPVEKTETIRANAEILRDYIASVKQVTGAQMVDLVAHSMGNLVSRYYIDRVMPGRDIAQMIMLGPPNQGTDCAYLPSSLGYFLPAALEIRPSYVRNIFNPQINRRHGVPFSIIAGTPIIEPVKSPCASVPSDLAIALDSAGGIPADIYQVDVWHSDLNRSPQVFQEFVRPLLQRTVDQFPSEPDPVPPTPAEEELQFTRVLTGHLNAGASATRTINIDNAAVANFALFDPTHSLTVTVRGATGNTIALDPTRNGLVVVQDPEALFYLGYGFTNPRPGPWQVTLQTTDLTPSTGTDYAITAHLQGGAVLKARVSTLLPQPDETIQLAAHLELAGQTLPVVDAQASVRYPNGEIKNIPLSANGGEWQASWSPTGPGLYGIDVVMNGKAPDGTPIERSAFLSLEAQPTSEQISVARFLLIAGIASLFVIMTAWILVRRRITARPKTE
ncbi:MAG TPA: hypothetical protein VF932_17065 [Anaerolineae bacterium]